MSLEKEIPTAEEAKKKTERFWIWTYGLTIVLFMIGIQIVILLLHQSQTELIIGEILLAIGIFILILPLIGKKWWTRKYSKN